VGVFVASTLVRARVDRDIEQRVTSVLDDIGLTVADAIRMLMTRIAKDGALPYELVVPNAETRAAMLRAREIKNARFATFEDLINDIEKEAERQRSGDATPLGA
jgi:DNA-damage-inducible protein J